jgi:FkbH-like protein
MRKIDTTAASPANAVHQYESQAVLFAARPSRLALRGLSVDVDVTEEVSVNVWRNHNFESLEPLAAPYFAFQGWRVDFRVSEYDDTFLFNGRQIADADILWIDSSRYLKRISSSEWLLWLKGRLNTLRADSTAPIILATWTEGKEEAEAIQSLVDAIPASYFADLRAVCDQTDVALFDPRAASMAGTPISSMAQISIARKLACHWLPGALLPPIKAVALDLDNTLHSGVLGEDGINGVQLTPEHIEFQQYIKSLQRQGVFVALVSRNEYADVENLFAQRQDYPLRWEDFSAIEVSWGSKGDALERIAKTLKISPDSVLFVDDNLGELASVSIQLPQTHTVYAHLDASLTKRSVQYYPALWRWKVGDDDTKRFKDMKANIERGMLAERLTDTVEYFCNLQVTLKYFYNPKDQLSRLADLSNKTNQFNLALQRFNQAELAERINSGNACIASVQLTDRLSDSGVIAIVVAERNGVELLIEELCISCRALGRELEDSIILPALRDMPIFSGCQKIVFRVQQGPRNRPALNWASRLLSQNEDLSSGIYSISAQKILEFSPVSGVTLIKENV